MNASSQKNDLNVLSKKNELKMFVQKLDQQEEESKRIEPQEEESKEVKPQPIISMSEDSKKVNPQPIVSKSDNCNVKLVVKNIVNTANHDTLLSCLR